MKREVTVKINYCKFYFGQDVNAAVSFADTAAETADRTDNDVFIGINYKKDDEEEEKE